MLTRLLVYFAYFLKSSARYQNTKRFFYNLLENRDSRLKSWFDAFMICLVMLSVFLMIYPVDAEWKQIDRWFERCVIMLFIMEYLLRLWLYNDSHKIILEHYEKAEYLNIPFRPAKVLWFIVARKVDYMLTPMALIDLLVILPGYRPLWSLRIFVVFRLFKLFRYFSSVGILAEILSSKRFELYTLAVFLGFLAFIGSTAIYLFENPTNSVQVGNLFDAFYFSIVTLSTVGFGDISAHTTGGRVVTMVMILCGLGILSFLTSILVSAFNDKMHELREHRTYAELKRYDSFVIICGFGRVGQHIARQLVNHRQHFVVIDINEDGALKAKHLGYLAIHADASNNEVLRNAGINNRASAVLYTTGNDVVNVYITLTSRHLNAGIRIISRANNQENVKKMYQAGANNVIQPFETAGMVIAEYIGQPVAFEAILGIVREEQDFIMETLCVHPGSFVEGKTIGALDFEQRKLMLMGVVSANPLHSKHKNSYPIKNRHFYFNPAKYFELQSGDLLVLLGRDVSIDYFRQQIEKSRLKFGKRL